MNKFIATALFLGIAATSAHAQPQPLYGNGKGANWGNMPTMPQSYHNNVQPVAPAYRGGNYNVQNNFYGGGGGYRGGYYGGGAWAAAPLIGMGAAVAGAVISQALAPPVVVVAPPPPVYYQQYVPCQDVVVGYDLNRYPIIARQCR